MPERDTPLAIMEQMRHVSVRRLSMAGCQTPERRFFSGRLFLFPATMRPGELPSASGESRARNMTGLTINCLPQVLALELALWCLVQAAVPSAGQTSSQTLLSRGQDAAVRGDWKAAEDLFQEAVHVDPRSASSYAALGSAQLRLGKLGEAQKSFAEAIKLEPRQPLFRMRLAEIYLRQARLDAAAKEYNAVINLDPGSFDAHYNLGRAYLIQKSCKKALAQFGKAEELSSSHPEVAINIVDAHFCAGNEADAKVKAERVQRQWWDSPQVLYSLGLVMFKNGSYESADRALARAWELLPNETEIGMQVVRCKLARRSFPEALTTLQTLRNSTAPTDKTEVLLGEAYSGLGDNDSAIEAFRRATRLNPRSASAHLALGRQLFESSDLDDALSHLREAHRLAPSDAAAAISLAQVMAKGGQFKEVIGLLESYAPDPSASPEVLSLLGVSYASLGRFSSAIPMLEVVTRRMPENDRARFLLAFAHAELGHGKEAVSAYEAAIRLNPRQALYYAHYASLLERQGQLAAAEESLRKALALQPKSPVVHYGLGRILAQAGRYREAIEHLQNSIAAGQPPSRAYYLLATCYTRLGDASRAKEYRDKFAQMAAQEHREEYINLSGDIEALSFGRSQFALPPSAGASP